MQSCRFGLFPVHSGGFERYLQRVRSAGCDTLQETEVGGQVLIQDRQGQLDSDSRGMLKA